jgi:hypothetical protein
MFDSSIKADGVVIYPGNFLSLRLCGDRLDIMTTEGRLTAVTDRPRALLRDVIAGARSEFMAKTAYGTEPFVYQLAQVDFSRRIPQSGVPNIEIPDNVPLPHGLILMETKRWADYHPIESLQIVGVFGGNQLILGFTASTYRLSFPEGIDVRKMFSAVTGKDIASGACHLTSFPPEAFLNLLPSHRTHCATVVAIPQRPESLGGLSVLLDLRTDPKHAAFHARAPKLETSAPTMER